ncbi:hypothetical protein N7532_007100 [Penicillium argentinense]|uniref:Major facilitator superfamily (MFS) profile domain-containing protein n=1 Tax=Penicillium argentinense TaxID=1131581 RepID=A0A9W9FH85_9EURO|nr:uncharacterized protein N7532_007100 [Penicillium argentinense]KAJ5100099.1 hypothetical protein N7532_007100 [Penicillium argentinense]
MNEPTVVAEEPKSTQQPITATAEEKHREKADEKVVSSHEIPTATTTANATATPDAPEDGPDRGYSRLSMVMMVVFSGLAIGSDGFNASIIGNIELLMAVIYPNSLTTEVAARLSNAFMVGMIIGMLSFGYISDKLGRKTGAVLTTTILVLGIALSAGASGLTEDGMFWMLIIARGIAGVGAGGEYPVAGAGAAEATDEAPSIRRRRGFIFAMIGDLSASLGFAFGALVPLILLLCFHQEPWVPSPPLHLLVSLPHGDEHRVSEEFDEEAAHSILAGGEEVLAPFARRVWLVVYRFNSISYNYISYPFGLFSSTIVGRVNPSSSLALSMAWGTLINCFYIPGAFIGGFLSDKIGRRRTMALGFMLQAILGFILGGALGPIQTKLPLFIVLYGIFLTLGEIGPGSTIVLAASESFPTAVRGHGVGLAAAWSKAGAAIGTQVFKPILASWGDDSFRGTQAVFLIGSGFAILGACLAWFILQDSNKILDHGDQEWKDYLIAHGYTHIEWGVEGEPAVQDAKDVD